ncbi:DUF2164 domain-containing protein [Clostridium fungisolvens]|uniref:DUF2164 domain-containing protein n=1 Tax=Clostridium fungisolvens TaxID=1604897 RepID=A0A6V8ST55_9CLOT|nr:DUF2164 domain-containing protein [Clostridium fungisolvens]GFP78083.1 hypothetical protein bsdtw1_04277 [Clostridium fungisolvens]
MRKEKKITLSKESRDSMISSIQEFFHNERDEEIGNLAASAVLDFIVEELSSEFYNQGINDAYRYISERTEDMLGLQK